MPSVRAYRHHQFGSRILHGPKIKHTNFSVFCWFALQDSKRYSRLHGLANPPNPNGLGTLNPWDRGGIFDACSHRLNCIPHSRAVTGKVAPEDAAACRSASHNLINPGWSRGITSTGLDGILVVPSVTRWPKIYILPPMWSLHFWMHKMPSKKLWELRVITSNTGFVSRTFTKNLLFSFLIQDD